MDVPAGPSDVLQRLVAEMYARGLSARDIEEALTDESYTCWLDCLRHMVGRGLRMPVTITSDGAPGVLRAIEEVWPQSLRPRCWVHTMRNILDKIPEMAKAEIKAHVLTIRDAPTL